MVHQVILTGLPELAAVVAALAAVVAEAAVVAAAAVVAEAAVVADAAVVAAAAVVVAAAAVVVAAAAVVAGTEATVVAVESPQAPRARLNSITRMPKILILLIFLNTPP
jgi:hypothetical protein